MIAVYCCQCGKELGQPGALIFGPPSYAVNDLQCRKYHMCIECFYDHTVIFDVEDFTIEHSFECRLSGKMADCPYHKAVRLMTGPHGIGRFTIVGLDSNACPVLVAAP